MVTAVDKECSSPLFVSSERVPKYDYGSNDSHNFELDNTKSNIFRDNEKKSLLALNAENLLGLN